MNTKSVKETETDYLKKQSSDMNPADFLNKQLSDWNCDFDHPLDSQSFLVSYLNNIATGLDQVEKTRILSVVAEYAYSKADEIRTAVAKCLGFLGEQGLSLVEKLMSDSDVIVRCEALESYAKIMKLSSVDRIISVFRSDSEQLVRFCAITILLYLKDFRQTEIFMEALETDSYEIFSVGCKYLALKQNRGVYKFLRQKYIRTSDNTEKAGLSYALFMHGEKDKLKKLFSILKLPGEANFEARLDAAMFLNYIYWQSGYRIRKRILKVMKNAVMTEISPRIAGELSMSISGMESDIMVFEESGKTNFPKSDIAAYYNKYT